MKFSNLLILSVFAVILLFAPAAPASETILLQLKWKHQFQFAGYYAAAEKGFYREEGLAVKFLEGRPNLFPIDEVTSGKAHYGIAGSEILLKRVQGRPVVVLAAVFQHSPRVIIVRRDSHIHSVHELIGKKVAMGKQIDVLAENYAMLSLEGVPPDKIEVVERFDINDLILKQVDAFSGYVTVQTFELQRRGVPFNILNPITYGIDFYGDCLFTSEAEMRQHPERAAAFRRASLRGWAYAMAHTDEMVDLILHKYADASKTEAHLRFEAEEMRHLIVPKLIEIGHINPGRWKHIGDTYAKLGIIPKDYTLDGFLYDPVRKIFKWDHWSVKWGIGIVAVSLGSALLLLFINLKIQSEIVSRRRAEAELRESEERFRSLTRLSPGGVYQTDAEGDCIFANEAWLEMAGMTLPEALGKGWLKGLHPEDRERIRSAWYETVASDGKWEVECRYMTPSGDITWVVCIGKAIFDKKGNRTGYIGLNLPVNELRMAEEKYRRIADRLKTAQQMAGLGYWDWEMATGELTWSDDVYDIFGQDKKTFQPTAESFEACIHPEDLPEFLAERKAALAEYRYMDIEHRIVLPDGSVRHVHELAEMVRDESDAVVRVSGAVQDITRQKTAEVALRKSERDLRLTLEATTDGIWTWNFQTGELVFSPRYYTMLGYEPDEFPANYENWIHLIHPDDREKALAVAQAYMNSKSEEYSNEFRLKTKTGDYRRILAHGRVTERDADGEEVYMIGNHTDITELKTAEKELRESEAKYRTIMESMDDPAYICSSDYRIEYLNPAMIKEIGRDATGEKCHLAIHNLEERCPWCCDETVKKGESIKTELNISGKDRIYYMSHSPVFHSDGSVSKLSIYRDITELKKLETRIQQAQKMESIGNLAGGIAHDFNNILFPVIGMSELLLEDLPPQSFESESVGEILKAGKRGAELVKQILTFSRQTEHKRIPVRPQQILKEVMRLIRATIPSYIEINENIRKDCGMILADPTQIHQIAMNILTNAYHALDESESGTIDVSLKETALETDDFPGSDLETGRYALLSISDNGKGMMPDVVNKIFEPYFTTKEQGKGTGLGLAVVYGIIREYKGEIRVYSEPGKGSTFNIYLPLRDDPNEEDTFEPLKNLPAGNEKILIVDDEVPIADLEKKMLERLGYTVTSRVNSLEALEAFRARPDAYDLVITDMSMPNMAGDQLAGEMLAIKPGIPIIICTGFSERLSRQKVKALGINGVLMKPVVKSELAKMVRDVLDAVQEERRKAE